MKKIFGNFVGKNLENKYVEMYKCADNFSEVFHKRSIKQRKAWLYCVFILMKSMQTIIEVLFKHL